ncbi:MAG: TIR domain-containing protein [Methyloligellaceae bacterium]
MSIFLSYASENREIAELITFAMRARGYDVFLDKDDLPAGSSYEDKIENAIKQSDLFIFLISKSSIQSGRYTLTETSIARKKWKNPQNRVLPVMIEQVDFAKVPVYLRSVSVLQPHGDPAAEVCTEAAQLLKVQKEEQYAGGNIRQLPFARFLRRALSSAIDSIFLFLFLIGIFYNLFIDVPATQQSIGLTIFLRIVSISAIVGFYAVSLLNLGGTPGDRFFQMKIVDEESRNPLSVGQAFIWTGCYLALFYISWIWYFYDPKKRMLHNIVSKTIVLSESKDDRIEQMGENTYKTIRKKVQERDFQSDFRYFQDILDQIKPDRNTQLAQKNEGRKKNATTASNWKLEGAGQNGAPLAFRLAPGSNSRKIWTIGRQSGECDFKIDHGNVSRKHAEISFDPSAGLLIRDLSSTNGTYLNGKKLTNKWKNLTDGDKVYIGSAKLKLSRI